MDCQEWKDKDLSEGYKKFARDLNKVNHILYAFGPYEDAYCHGYSILQQWQLDALHLTLQKRKKMIQRVL